MSIPVQQDQLLLATLVHVPFDGWSQMALRHAERDLDLVPGTALCLFPRGMADVVLHLEDWANRQMTAGWTATPGAQALRVSQRIALLIRLRLGALAPYREALRRLPGYYGATLGAGDLGGRVWQTCDQIWRLAGDTATDFNYYSKRSLLAGVYSATLLYWLRDNSPDSGETFAFLERRLGNVMRLPGLTAPIKRMVQGVGTLAGQARSVLRPRS